MAYEEDVTIMKTVHSTMREHESKGTPAPSTMQLSTWMNNCMNPFGRFDHFKDRVMQCRKLKEQGEDYLGIKTQLPVIKPSGIFHTSDGDRLIKHSGWMQVDLDKSDNPGFLADIEEAKQELGRIKEVAYVARSTTDGIWALVKLPDDEEISEEDHKAFFKAMEEALLEYGINVDSSCKNAGRLRFYSFDPNPIWKPIHQVEPFRKKVYPKKDRSERSIERSIDGKGRKSIDEARRVVENQGEKFEEGSKHDYLFALASITNKMAIPYEDLQAYVDEHLMSIEEITTNCLFDPYKRFSEEYNTWE